MPDCPPGFEFKKEAGICYKVIKGQLTWYQAKDLCIQYGGKLAEPR